MQIYLHACGGPFGLNRLVKKEVGSFNSRTDSSTSGEESETGRSGIIPIISDK